MIPRIETVCVWFAFITAHVALNLDNVELAQLVMLIAIFWQLERTYNKKKEES